MPIAPNAMAFGWSPGALTGSRGDRTVPHLLTSNSNWRKRHGGASVVGPPLAGKVALDGCYWTLVHTWVHRAHGR